jgi:hypothetical protein
MEFTGHLKIVTIGNYNAIANSHTLQNTITHTTFAMTDIGLIPPQHPTVTQLSPTKTAQNTIRNQTLRPLQNPHRYS